MKNLILLALSVCIAGCGLGRGEVGYHRGHITDVSVAGILCKTIEGQIMSGSGAAALHYDFTVGSQAVYDKLKEAQNNGREVNIHYISPVYYSLCASSFPNIVDDVQYVGEQK